MLTHTEDQCTPVDVQPLRRDLLAAPFPWFGGKSRVADEVWRRFGDTPNYVEPFAGSLATLLGRPTTHQGRIETVNDADGFLVNFWRAAAADSQQVAQYADWPVSEADLSARHIWLVSQRADLTARLCGDPDFFDVKVAGWWVWGICAWIGSGFCSGRGRWTSVDGRLTQGAGVGDEPRQLPHLGDGGQGINRQLPDFGNGGRGVHRLDTPTPVAEWFATLAARLRRTRIACGDWSRIVTDSVTVRHGITAVFLDPPYGDEVEQTRGLYANDDGTISDKVRSWALANGGNPLLRIALCGYAGEGHEALQDAGWTVHEWKARGGFIGANVGGTADQNRRKERIWFSPHCVNLRKAQLDLFDLEVFGGAA